MDWLATIDVPAMTLSQTTDKDKEGEILADVLMTLKQNKVKILFREELYGMLSWECMVLNKAVSQLSEDDYIKYESNVKAQHITSTPDVTQGVKEQEEIRYQLYNFHTGNSQTSKIYLVSRFEPTTGTLQTILNSRQENHSLLYYKNKNDIESFMTANRPRLVQLKHHGTQYVLGGNPVSPFTAFNSQDQSAAEELLRQAFDDYQGTITPGNYPDALFTWDMVNRTYVIFRHSGNWEYHGHDIPATDINLPEYIKEKYNIWK